MTIDKTELQKTLLEIKDAESNLERAQLAYQEKIAGAIRQFGEEAEGLGDCCRIGDYIFSQETLKFSPSSVVKALCLILEEIEADERREE